jgi:hypothetical protein
MQPKSKASPMKESANGDLRARILPPDPAHHAAAGLPVDQISH